MMQATNLCSGNNLTLAPWLNFTWNRRVATERQVWAAMVIVVEV